jgi:hypothetical protein
MSWYGVHSRWSRAEVKRWLPPGACKHCVYWFRVAIGSSPDTWALPAKCSRCGIPLPELLRDLSEQSRRR